MRRATIIFNPTAGPANFKEALEDVAAFWVRRGWKIQLTPTAHVSHAIDLAHEAASAGVHLVFAAGGDGTLSEVATGLASTETIMAPLPVGTANSFARELGMPRPGFFQPEQLIRASQALFRGRVQAMDLGVTQSGRNWLLWSGVGADSYVIDQIEPRPRWLKRLGPAGYVLQTVPALTGFTGARMSVTVDGETIQDTFLLVTIANCRLYGGEFLLNPLGQLDDGRFEVWMFRGKYLPTAVRYAAEVAVQQHLHDPDVIMRSGRQITVRADSPEPVQVDGEKAGQTPFSTELRERALRLLVPSTAPNDLFSHPGTPLRDG